MTSFTSNTSMWCGPHIWSLTSAYRLANYKGFLTVCSFLSKLRGWMTVSPMMNMLRGLPTYLSQFVAAEAGGHFEHHSIYKSKGASLPTSGHWEILGWSKSISFHANIHSVVFRLHSILLSWIKKDHNYSHNLTLAMYNPVQQMKLHIFHACESTYAEFNQRNSNKPTRYHFVTTKKDYLWWPNNRFVA